jgi:hypothetical protein
MDTIHEDFKNRIEKKIIEIFRLFFLTLIFQQTCLLDYSKFYIQIFSSKRVTRVGKHFKLYT